MKSKTLMPAGLVLIALGAALANGCAVVGGVFGVRSMYEQPGFTVLDSLSDSVEIRRYGTRLAAQVEVEETDEDDGGGRAFRILFDYIGGANRTGQEVAMTAPVEMREAEQIAMTAPVEMRESESGTVMMRFFLPSEHTPETAPVPTDPRVEIIELPPQTVAALRWRGRMSDTAFAERRDRLVALLADSPWEAIGEATAFVYDPPFAIPWVRRSEVAIPVAPRAERIAGEL